MQIKRFTERTLKEAAEKMKAQLGSEAVILSTRVIEPDNKIYTQKMFEITAGLDSRGIFTEPAEIRNENIKPVPKNNNVKKLYVDLYEETGKQTIKSIKTEPNPKPYKGVQEALKEVLKKLHDQELQKQVIAEIINEIKKYNKYLHTSNLENYILEIISAMINVKDIEFKKRKKTYVAAFTGPTGVGKTTTITKLAVIAKVINNLDVGIISLDTYRLGAIDQLRIFSDISGVDLLTAYHPDDLNGLYNKFRKKDIIFIDTTGRSQRNISELKRTGDFLTKIPIDENFLVLNATSSYRTLNDIQTKYRLLNYTSLIFTKLDEAVTFGNILNINKKGEVPISFLSNGQVIPDDIFSADQDYIAKMIFSGMAVK